ncbi:MAG: MFS transporter [Anaerolineales bacterium]
MKSLISFTVPNYRWLWLGHFLYVTSLVMYRLALGWLVLELTDSALWVGIAYGVDGAGKIITGFFAGVWVDRWDKRLVLLLAQLNYGVVALLLGVCLLTNLSSLGLILLAAFLLGATDSVAVPANNALVYQVVGRERIMNAAAVNMLGFNVARTVGAALAGNVLDQWGMGVCFVLTGVAAGLGALPLLMMRGVFRSAFETHEPFWRAMRDGLHFAWRDGTLRRLLGLSVIVELFGFAHYTMVPVIARDVLQVGATGLGYLSATSGIGATLGTAALAVLGDVKRKGRLLWSVTIAGGVGIILFALSPWYPLSLALGALIGALLASYDALLQTVMQLLTPDTVRGRILSLYTLTFGFTSVGGTLAGYVASLMGAPFAVAIGGGVVVFYLLSLTNTLKQIGPVADNATLAEATFPTVDGLG